MSRRLRRLWPHAGSCVLDGPGSEGIDRMGYTRQTPLQSGQAGRKWTVPRSGTVAPQPAPPSAPVRRFDISFLNGAGDAETVARPGPAQPAFEAAFSAFQRGALVQTPQGPVAVEDLIPGTEIDTAHGPQPLAWVGSMTLLPEGLSDKLPAGRLYRIAADGFGLGRPMPDLMLAEGARLVSHTPAVRAAAKADAALAPVSVMSDGMTVIRISPPSPVRVFHLVLERHAVIQVNGVETDSFHPAATGADALGPEMRRVYLSLFPHLHSFEGFGPVAMPRLSEHDLAATFAA
ncbi:Hint domain-containing protein [Tranquillimonas alkanivorans]|nr:Hint domain-containing protein [Tranquillimonas alkanivorans]